MVSRILKHLFMPPWLLHKHFSASLLGEIEAAVRESEKSHSGEIRFAVETTLSLPALLKGISGRQAAIAAFSNLRVWDTENNSGVLIYLLLADHDIEIVADRGIAGKVDQREWDDIAAHMEQQYRVRNFREGSLEGIHRVTELLAQHFPPEERNPNELPDKPVLLKK